MKQAPYSQSLFFVAQSYSRVDNCVGLPNSFTTEYTENTEKTFYILRELCVLPRHHPTGAGVW